MGTDPPRDHRVRLPAAGETDVVERRRTAVDTFEKTAEYKESQSLRAHNEPSQYPSIEDTSGRAGLPDYDETLSDSGDSSQPLHGSLHGNWSGPDGAE
jgi:hypothetical protein